jgi:hypothetical protein
MGLGTDSGDIEGMIAAEMATQSEAALAAAGDRAEEGAAGVARSSYSNSTYVALQSEAAAAVVSTRSSTLPLRHSSPRVVGPARYC